MHLVINVSFYKSTFDSAKEKQKLKLLIKQKCVYIPDVETFFSELPVHHIIYCSKHDQLLRCNLIKTHLFEAFVCAES